MSIVSQEPVLFAESIMYNITFGVQDPESVPLAQVLISTSLSLTLPLRPPCEQGFGVLTGSIGWQVVDQGGCAGGDASIHQRIFAGLRLRSRSVW